MNKDNIKKVQDLIASGLLPFDQSRFRSCICAYAVMLSHMESADNGCSPPQGESYIDAGFNYLGIERIPSSEDNRWRIFGVRGDPKDRQIYIDRLQQLIDTGELS